MHRHTGKIGSVAARLALGCCAMLPLATAYADGEGDGEGGYPTGSAPAITCASPSGCDLLGGVIPQKIVGTPDALAELDESGGTVTEQLCVVHSDPRGANCGAMSETGATALDISSVCPGFESTLIPNYLCGGSGPSGTGFAIIRGVADGVDVIPGLFIYSDASNSKALGGTSNPTCPNAVAAWVPRPYSVEGTIPEGNILQEWTGFCDPSGSSTKGMSFFAAGLVLTISALPGHSRTDRLQGFAATKFGNLDTTVSTANIVSTVKAKLQFCISKSEKWFSRQKFACAARRLVKCDAQVVANGNSFSSSEGNSNPYGDIRGRLANLYLTINTRILNNPPNTTWPLSTLKDHEDSSLATSAMAQAAVNFAPKCANDDDGD